LARKNSEKRIEKEKETSNYFRNNFKYYAPFVAIFDEYHYIFGGRFFMNDMTEESQVDQFRRLVPQFLEAYKVLRDSGHLALLPPTLRGQINRFGNYLTVTAKMEPSENRMDMDRFRRHSDLMTIGSYIYEGFRKLLDVESQDKKLEELADNFWPPDR
jgi:hypothetical protein